jgi:hypothetical protein
LGRRKDPGSGKKIILDPDPWGKNALDLGSGSATLVKCPHLVKPIASQILTDFNGFDIAGKLNQYSFCYFN